MTTESQQLVQLQQTNAQLVDASNQLTTEVSGKIGAINQSLDDKKQDVDDHIAGTRSEAPFYRMSKNQAGNVTAGVLDHYLVNNNFTITFSPYRQILSGASWASRDAEEQEILTAMGITGDQNFEPTIDVIRMTWSAWNASLNAYTFYQRIPLPATSTTACYAKLVSGSVNSFGFAGITSEWSLCGTQNSGGPGEFTNPHPFVSSESGEVLFFWYATIAGFMPIDKLNPQWGFFPYINVNDYTA